MNDIRIEREIPQIRVGNRSIGGAAPTFLVAEIGVNHNGDVSLAKESIDAAIESGADAVKFQSYRTEDFILDRSLTYSYSTAGRQMTESQFEMFKRYEFGNITWKELKAYCDEKGIIFHSTPSSERGIQDLVELKVPLLKNSSDYLTNLPIIRAMGRTGLPTVISTGISKLSDIAEAVDAFRDTGNDKLILLHCTSSYPTSPENVHLRKILTLQRVFECPVGLSDHSEGITAAVGAVALGAVLVEKHFTIDKNLPGPDHRFSSDPKEFKELVSEIRKVEKMLGRYTIAPAVSEKQAMKDFRLSCVATMDLRKGHILTRNDIAFCRPGTGVPPKDVKWLIGRRVKDNLKVGDVIRDDCVE